MGIKGLTKFLQVRAPASVRQTELAAFAGKVVAVDASVTLYQFMAAIQDGSGQQLTNAAGEDISHIVGMISRCINLLETGVKPVYVFDGDPPTNKSGELARRKALRTVKVTEKHNEDVKELLKYVRTSVRPHFVVSLPLSCSAAVSDTACEIVYWESMPHSLFRCVKHKLTPMPNDNNDQ
eukprot:GHVU01165697.1.p1 GENE.GHVU01165697.1~~GHVU01165697.1.p1  ORF type:complete len:208 (-),score=26.21 GHVU01165697.1:253-792(-)